ncbi:MAG: hypothetical protein H6581_22980 [Bacteroidia bacterium]|nr:hypothetical protein [Bacteroidia bacterium]
MNTGIILDAAPGFMLVTLGGIMLLVLALAIVLEGFILYFLGYKPLKNSLVDSLIINLVSGLAGLLLSLGPRLDFLDQGKYQVIIFLFAITLVIEGLILTFLRKKSYSVPRVWLAAFLINVASYGFLLGFMLIQEIA